MIRDIEIGKHKFRIYTSPIEDSIFSNMCYVNIKKLMVTKYRKKEKYISVIEQRLWEEEWSGNYIKAVKITFSKYINKLIEENNFNQTNNITEDKFMICNISEFYPESWCSTHEIEGILNEYYK